MFRFPDVYKVGVSVAPVPDQKLYDTIYQERYMGVPQENDDGYGRLPDQLRGRPEGKLLIVHGSGDDNVHYREPKGDQPPGRARQAIRFDGLSEPNARDL